MATTYTTSLKLNQIGNGEQSGTWGTTTNTNWNIIEQAVAGAVSITMANADYTLANPNGTTGEAHAMMLLLTGTSSSNQIIAPAVSKIYIVKNGTSGPVVMAASGLGTTLSIPASTTAQVYCDGTTGFYAGLTASTGNFNVNGNLTVAGSATATSFSGAGTGLTGTAAGLSIGGNAATATTATTATTADALNTGNIYTGTGFSSTNQSNFQGSQATGMATATGNLGGFMVQGNGSGAAFASFHRPGVYAAYFGIDTDNQWKVGGWSAGANAYPILTSANYNSYSPTLTGGSASGTWGINISGTAGNVNNSTGLTINTAVSVQPLTTSVNSNLSMVNTGSGIGDQFTVQARPGISSGYFYYNSSNVYGTISDQRIKSNISPIIKSEALNYINRVEPATFTIKGQTEVQAGFIAQNLLSASHDEPQRNVLANVDTYDPNDPNCLFMGVSDRPLIAYLVAAVQELSTKVDTLQAELTALKG